MFNKYSNIEPEEKKEMRIIWRHEDILMNYRLTWLLVSQGLLFAAYGWFLRKDICQPFFPMKNLLILIQIVGFLISFTIAIGILAAILAQLILRKTGAHYWGELGVSSFTTILGWITHLALPIIFMSAWGYLLQNTCLASPSQAALEKTIPPGSEWTIMQIILKIIVVAVPAVATLLAAFFGAWFAYRLQDKAKMRKEQASNISAANSALFTIFQMLNSLKVIQYDLIDPVREHPGKFIAMGPILYQKHANYRFEFPNLLFLLNTKYKQILLDLFIEQQRFQEAINVLNFRSELHIYQVQPILEKAGIQEGAEYTTEELAKVLGQRLFKMLQRTTDQLIYHIDRTVGSLYDVKDKMVTAFKELYSDADFLNFELLEVPSKKEQ